MSRIELHSNWGDEDRLDGVALDAGEVLMITWPDGMDRETVVHIQNGSYELQDHRHPWSVSTKTAYALVEVYGVKVRLPLRGLEAVRVRQTIVAVPHR